VKSFHDLKISNKPPSEALKGGLPMAVFATDGCIVPAKIENLPYLLVHMTGVASKNGMGISERRGRGPGGAKIVC
jgi:hypothetical protein